MSAVTGPEDRTGGKPGTVPRIVVGVDGSPGSRAALSWALDMAARRGARLDVVAAFRADFYWMDPYLVDRDRIAAVRTDTEARARALVDEVRAERAATGVPGEVEVPVQVEVAAGVPAEHLVRIAEGQTCWRSAAAGGGRCAARCSGRWPCTARRTRCARWSWSTRARALSSHASSWGWTVRRPHRAALRQAVDAATDLGGSVEAVVVFRLPDYWTEFTVLVLPPVAELRDAALQRGEEDVQKAARRGPSGRRAGGRGRRGPRRRPRAAGCRGSDAGRGQPQPKPAARPGVRLGRPALRPARVVPGHGRPPRSADGRAAVAGGDHAGRRDDEQLIAARGRVDPDHAGVGGRAARADGGRPGDAGGGPCRAGPGPGQVRVRVTCCGVC